MPPKPARPLLPERLTILVDGRQLAVPAGTTVAAALLNRGIAGFRASPGGEPRGPLCAMGTCQECRVTIDGVPHRRACLEPCREGMFVERAALPAGAMPGPLRHGPMDPRPKLTVDVAVVGGGPAGIAAACAAADAGATVALLDENPAPGGQIWRAGAGAHPPAAARRWLTCLAASKAEAVFQAAVFDADRAGSLRAEVAGRPLTVAWKRLVIATGARERFLPFPGWTLPGAVGVGAAQALVKAGLEVRGRRAVVAGSGPLLLAVAALLRARGARVAVVLEQAPGAAVHRFARGLSRRPRKLLAAARLRTSLLGVPYRTGAWVTAAAGDGRVEEIAWTDGSHEHRTACDLLCCAYGLIPNLELPRRLGCRLESGFVAVDADQKTEMPADSGEAPGEAPDEVPAVSGEVPAVYCAGEPTGIAGVEQALLEGEIAGLAAAGRRADEALYRRRDRGRAWGVELAATFRLRPELLALARPETIVCRCEDVRYGSIDPSWEPRQAKLASRASMGACQGRVCGPALAALAAREEWALGAVRAPLQPVAIGSLIGSSADGEE